MNDSDFIAGYDAGWDVSGEGKNAEYTSPRYTQERYEAERAEALAAWRAGSRGGASHFIDDLDELERRARGYGARWWDRVVDAPSPQDTVALIARIRELEAAATGNDCRAPGPQPCECCAARGSYQG